MKKLVTLLILVSFSLTFIASSFAEDTMMSAEMRMKALAIKREQSRIIGSNFLIAMGILTIISGVAVAGNTSDMDTNSSLTWGLLIAGMGGIVIAMAIGEKEILTPIEISYGEIASMESVTETDKAKREDLAAGYLKKYADEGHRDRMTTVILNTVLGGVLASNPHDAETRSWGYAFLATAPFGFFLKTDVEYEYDDYLKSKTASGEVFIKTESLTNEAPVR